MNPETISPAELHQRGVTRLFDVRTPAEFHQGHAQGAISEPDERALELAAASSEPIYLICRGGTRSESIRARIRAANPDAKVIIVEGGTLAWEAAGLPVLQAPKPIRPRLYRLAFVGCAISVALAFLVHPGCLGVAGLIAAGLVFDQMLILRWFFLTGWADCSARLGPQSSCLTTRAEVLDRGRQDVGARGAEKE